ncbi:MAG: Stp1/IreP family PP2C-type Ser/Thr phosphatase [Endomicrobiales bacterium]|jgi:protein phosphatase
MPLEFKAKTDLGLVRKNNEDAWLIEEKSGLFMIADGLGGANAGEVASTMALDVIAENFSQSENLIASILSANDMIFEASRSSAQYKGMGTTVVACVIHKDVYTIAWVGDSRLYMVRNKQIQPLTTDHSIVQEQITKGLITSESAKTVHYKNVLTRALGVDHTVEPGCIDIPAMNDDFLVLCSDGLHGMISDAEILEIVLAQGNPAAICGELIAQANKAGGRDNCTVIVIHYTSGVPVKKKMKNSYLIM